MHRVAIQLTRKTHGKIRNINHFLDFAITFRLGLAHFQRNQRTQCVLVITQGIRANADRFAATWRRNLAPCFRAFLCTFDDRVVIGLAARVNTAERFTRRRIDRFQNTRIHHLRPFVASEVGARFVFGEVECGQNWVRHLVLRLS